MPALVIRAAPAAVFDWRAILEEIGPQLAKEGQRCDDTGEFARSNLELLRERGFLAAVVPAELGGQGLSRTETAAMLRALTRYCGSTALALAMHTHPTAAAAWRWRHQKAPTDGLLKKIAGEGVQLLTSGGSDWLASSGRADKVEGGYRVHARKSFASGAPTANLFMTGALTEEEADGPTVLQFAVPMNAQGVSVVETWDTLGMRGTGSHDVVLDGVFVPDAAVSARRKPGVWHPLMHLVSMIAFPLVYSVYTGLAEQARDIAVVAAAKRKDPGMVEAVGEMDTELASARMACDSLVAFCESATPDAATTNTVFMYRSLIARSAIRTVDLAMEAVGGASYFRHVGLERVFRDIQGARFHPLTPSVQRQLAGRTALGLPIDG
jgi:acyl-CoA dehydrogenase